MVAISESVNLTQEGDIAILAIDNPPVNCIESFSS